MTDDGKAKVEEAGHVLMTRDLRVEVHFFDAQTGDHLFNVTDPAMIVSPGDTYTIKYPEAGFRWQVS